MIILRSKLSIIDNSGGRVAMCVRVLRRGARHFGCPGDVVVLTIRRLWRILSVKRVEIGGVYLGVLVAARKVMNRMCGMPVCARKNAVVLLTSEFEPIGKRVHYCMFFELRVLGFLRIVLMTRRIF